ncbi:uncharacterized protein MYCGRDRAFT_108951 [Zymoseptoria tritici IPO323]|uniref:Uncharacterized protein n=1 Tax=Zymoseptoria tritici (strain CBS 115943 / IPO323) TaxID=336722 RepID=F9X872_ZYMTI|nr:uncharacterized protein MYCGRDRAFT_108951 [Zymoseptoria tritici IPO323]EGP87810.1 hypothetical protein MYCGRDRAFT_108951 [Zymoseptoria tritici IPO323]
MSSDALAVFRKGLGPDLNALAEKHLQHDLRQSDRDALVSAASTVTTHTTLGSLLGLTLSSLLALRLRRSRAALFRAFKSVEKPHSVRFADGREEVLPDMTSLMRPSKVGDVATFALLGMGGLFLGGEVGLLTGSFRARQGIGKDREGRDRIAGAFKKFRADALRKQAEDLERDADAGEGRWI